MKENLLFTIGKYLMGKCNLTICIVDDEESFFNKNMLNIAREAGYKNIERYLQIDKNLFSDLLKNPRDIIILDIKGITKTDIAKNGLDIASVLYKQTSTYIAITSAHKFYLQDIHKGYDYIIENRLLTAVDFVDELDKISFEYVSKKANFYKKNLFKIGLKIIRKTVL